MRFEALISSYLFPISAKPYVQPSAVLCAVDVSITQTSGFSISDTASLAASSGRHRKTMSALLSMSLRAAVSFLSSSGIEISSMSFLSESLWTILSPVVPALPSMNTFFIAFPPDRQAVSSRTQQMSRLPMTFSGHMSSGRLPDRHHQR